MSEYVKQLMLALLPATLSVPIEVPDASLERRSPSVHACCLCQPISQGKTAYECLVAAGGPLTKCDKKCKAVFTKFFNVESTRFGSKCSLVAGHKKCDALSADEAWASALRMKDAAVQRQAKLREETRRQQRRKELARKYQQLPIPDEDLGFSHDRLGASYEFWSAIELSDPLFRRFAAHVEDAGEVLHVHYHPRGAWQGPPKPGIPTFFLATLATEADAFVPEGYEPGDIAALAMCNVRQAYLAASTQQHTTNALSPKFTAWPHHSPNPLPVSHAAWAVILTTRPWSGCPASSQ